MERIITRDELSSITNFSEGEFSANKNKLSDMSFSSYPDIFYLHPDHDSSFQNVQIISRDRSCIRSHQALLGASCSNLKKCLLDPRLILESEAVIICPDYSKEELEQFLHILYGGASAKEATDVVQNLLFLCGFITEPVKPAGSIANIKSEIVIPEEEDEWHNLDHEGNDSGGGEEEDSDDRSTRKRKRKRASNGDLPSFRCEFCPEVYKYRARYETHLFKAHGVEDPESAEKECERCGKSVLLRKKRKHDKKCQSKKPKKNPAAVTIKQEILDELVSPMIEPKIDLKEKLDEELELKCSSCDEMLKQKDMKEHLQLVHGVVSSYPCTACAAIFSEETEYKTHWTEVHTKKQLVKAEPKDDDDDDHLSDFVVDEDELGSSSSSESSSETDDDDSEDSNSEDEDYHGARKKKRRGKKRGPKPGSKRKPRTLMPKFEPLMDPNQPGKLICPTDGCDVAKDSK